VRAADFTDGTDGEYAIKGNLPGGRLGEGRSWVRNIISRLGRSGQGVVHMKMTSEKRAVDKIFRRRDRYDIPDWQRGEVWTREKKQGLIDSMLRGWKLPKFYFVEASDDGYLVEDGQQRLIAIFEFFS